MHLGTIYTKTQKGVQELENRTIRLPRDLGLLFLAVDGKRAVSELPQKAGIDVSSVEQALEKLIAEGYIKDTCESSHVCANDFDLDFTTPAAMGAAA